MDQRQRPKKSYMTPSLVSLDANAAKAVLETKADPRDPNARAILKFIGGSKAELQPKIDIELQTPVSALGCRVESLCAGTQARRHRTSPQNADRIGRSPARGKKRAATRQRISAYGSPGTCECRLAADSP